MFREISRIKYRQNKTDVNFIRPGHYLQMSRGHRKRTLIVEKDKFYYFDEITNQI